VAIVDKFGFQFRQYFTTFVIPESIKISLKSQQNKKINDTNGTNITRE
jgi:hypothetical protein